MTRIRTPSKFKMQSVKQAAIECHDIFTILAQKILPTCPHALHSAPEGFKRPEEGEKRKEKKN